MSDTAEAWNLRFAGRRPHLHKAESIKHFTEPTQRKEIIERFLSFRKGNLQPPGSSLYAHLARFFHVTTTDLERCGVVLLDDRCDDTAGSGVTVARKWDSEGGKGQNNGYMSYPPLGNHRFTEKLSAEQLRERLLCDVRGPRDRLGVARSSTANQIAETFDSCGKENNVRHMVLEDILVLIRGYCRYIANITPDCVFSLVETSSTLSLDVLRSFLSQHILFRPSFAIHFGPVSSLYYPRIYVC